MINTKTKTTLIKAEGIKDENSSNNKKSNNANGINTTSDSANMNSTKENLNLESILDNNNNLSKISHLFYSDENVEKIVNVSKLEEDLFSNSIGKNDKTKRHHTGDSNFQFMEANKSENNGSTIVNISNLDFQNNFQNETQNKIENIKVNETVTVNTNTSTNDNDNVNNQINQTEQIKISEIKREADEPIKVKKPLFGNISFRSKMIILIISVILILFLLTFIILKIIG